MFAEEMKIPVMWKSNIFVMLGMFTKNFNMNFKLTRWWLSRLRSFRLQNNSIICIQNDSSIVNFITGGCMKWMQMWTIEK